MSRAKEEVREAEREEEMRQREEGVRKQAKALTVPIKPTSRRE